MSRARLRAACLPACLQVAILCNHQRSIPKAHGNQMEKMQEKAAAMNAELAELEDDLRVASSGKSPKDPNKKLGSVES